MDVESRIEQLSADLRATRVHVRRLRGAVAAMGAACALLLLTGASPDVAQVVRARRVEVIAPNGQTAVTLSVTDQGDGAISMYDDEGHPLVALRTNELGGGNVITFNRSGYQLVELGRARDGEQGGVWVFDGAGRKLTALTAGLEGDGEVRAYNKFGHMLSILRGTEKNGGALRLSDSHGRDFVTLGTVPGGRAGLHVADSAGDPGISLSSAGGAAQLVAYAHDGTVFAQWPSDAVPAKTQPDACKEKSGEKNCAEPARE